MQLILNRDFQHPTDGWYNIEAKGNHSNAEAGVVQVIDDAACESIVNRFNAQADDPEFPGMLIDHEHFRHDADKETIAYGWLTRLQNRADGIYGQIRWTSTGQKAVNGGDYRFFSTEYAPKDCTILNKDGKTPRIRPMALAGITLTNDPNNKGQKPITNREQFPPGAVADADNTGAVSAPITHTKMKTVCTLLGLSADASEESVYAAVTNIKNRAETAEKAVTPIQTKLTAAETRIKELETDQVDTDLDTFKNRYAPAQKDFVRGMLITNRASAIEFLKAQPEVKTETSPGRVHNRAAATPPAPGAGLSESESVQAESRQTAIAEYKIKNRCTHEKAVNAVRRKNPELFGLSAQAQ
jgi:phage I-like protein